LARIFEVDPSVIRRRLRARNLVLAAHPQDARVRLVMEVDAAAIFQIVPAPRRTRNDGVREDG
jgi:hypothetical protein